MPGIFPAWQPNSSSAGLIRQGPMAMPASTSSRPICTFPSHADREPMSPVAGLTGANLDAHRHPETGHNDPQPAPGLRHPAARSGRRLWSGVGSDGADPLWRRQIARSRPHVAPLGARPAGGGAVRAALPTGFPLHQRAAPDQTVRRAAADADGPVRPVSGGAVRRAGAGTSRGRRAGQAGQRGGPLVRRPPGPALHRRHGVADPVGRRPDHHHRRAGGLPAVVEQQPGPSGHSVLDLRAGRPGHDLERQIHHRARTPGQLGPDRGAQPGLPQRPRDGGHLRLRLHRLQRLADDPDQAACPVRGGVLGSGRDSA